MEHIISKNKYQVWEKWGKFWIPIAVHAKLGFWWIKHFIFMEINFKTMHCISDCYTYQFFSESVAWVRVSFGMEYTCFRRPLTNVVTLGYPLYSGSRVRMVSNSGKRFNETRSSSDDSFLLSSVQFLSHLISSLGWFS